MKTWTNDLKRHIMTGISYMLPVVVAAGMMMALGYVFGGPGVNDPSSKGTFAYYVANIGTLGMTLFVPTIAAAIAYSAAGRVGIGPGLIVGLISTDIKAGFIGGIVGGLIVGYVANRIKKIKIPKSMSGMMPILIIPLCTTFIVGLLMYFVIGIPIAAFMNFLTNFLTHLSGGSKFLYGATLSALCGIDYGGPITKTVSLFTTGLMTQGIIEPKAAHMLGSMIPPMGILVAYALSGMFKKNIFSKKDKENVKPCLPMGICMITECVIPFAMKDYKRVVISSVIGDFVAGGIVMSLGVGSPVPHGGWFVIPLMHNPWGFVLSLAIGSLVMGTVLFLIKKPIPEDMVEEDEFDLFSGDKLNDDDFSIQVTPAK
jgi:fructose PTS system EIIBC or EIIC component